MNYAKTCRYLIKLLNIGLTNRKLISTKLLV